jgi:hypothetical protein
VKKQQQINVQAQFDQYALVTEISVLKRVEAPGPLRLLLEGACFMVSVSWSMGLTLYTAEEANRGLEMHAKDRLYLRIAAGYGVITMIEVVM